MIRGLVVRITLNMSFPKQRNNVVFSVPRFELLILNSGSKSREASMKIMNFLMPRQEGSEDDDTDDDSDEPLVEDSVRYFRSS
jgi:hypothetical protein